MMFLLPLINLYLAFNLLIIYCVIVFCLGLFGSFKEKRPELMLALPGYIFLKYVNAWIFLEQFFKEIILRKKDMHWFKPERVKN